MWVERAAEGVQPVLLLVSCDLSQHSSSNSSWLPSTVWPTMQLLSSTMQKPCTRAPAQLGQTACQTPRALSTASAKPTWCNCRCSCQSARLSNTSGRAWYSSPNQLHNAAPVRHHNNLVLCVADHQQLCQVRCADIPRVSVGVRVLMLHKLVPLPHAFAAAHALCTSEHSTPVCCITSQPRRTTHHTLPCERLHSCSSHWHGRCC